MSEPPERPRLSGLARSIDALFFPTTKGASGAPRRDAPGLLSFPESESEGASGQAIESDAPIPPLPLLPLDERPLAPDIFPASQLLEAIGDAPPRSAGEPFGAELPVASSGTEPMPESLLTFDSPFAHMDEPVATTDAGRLELAPSVEDDDEPSSAPIESFEPVGRALTAADSATVELADLAALSDGAPTSTGEPTETAEALKQAVADYLSGDLDARERIERIAAVLRDRLALDPLADAVEALVRAAGEPPKPDHVEVASAVINPAVASRIVQRLGRERDEAKRAAYFALCRRLGRVMINALKGALTGALEPSVRRVYYDAMISMGETSRPVLEAMLEDENRFLVRDAVAMLGEIGGPRAVELVTRALADTDPRVRAEALHALAKLGDVEAGRLTLGFLEDADSNVRLAAALAAGKLGLQRALRPLLNLLDDEDAPATRVQLLQALGNLGDPGAVPVIEKHASPPRFSKTSTDVRVAAYRALHRIGTPHARELVRRAATDRDPGVRAALRGLAVQEP